MLSVRVLIDSCAGGRSKENENAAAARCMIDNVILTSSERASHDRHSFSFWSFGFGDPKSEFNMISTRIFEHECRMT